ncbi:MAG: class I SAM-dependent RNA methyltransferase [Oscillospiraceae bacterium]|nr:class I SAM-dependent RNA methyltransferase [Oscillospiraceae bacterium]
MEFEFCVPCLFGLEGLCADELKRLNLHNVRTENGRVLFSGGAGDIAKANINLRTGERVLLVAGGTRADSFDELFEGVRAMPWERYIPVDGAFPVKGHSLGSKLHSVPDCQRIIKKAAVERLKSKHKTQWLKETGVKYQIQFSIMNDVAALYIDTTGAGLYKRGYRLAGNAAPLRETLAAAIVKLSRYRGRESVCDPFCGSGTIPIEAALAAINRAPGMNRSFQSQKWVWLERRVWADAVQEAKSREFHGSYDIWGGDIDPKSIDMATANAKRAGVSSHIRFETADALEFWRDVPGGIIMTNPPYGERVMLHSEAESIYRGFGIASKKLNDWKMYILSSHAEFERILGKTASKKRKLYNGMIKCDLYMYY